MESLDNLIQELTRRAASLGSTRTEVQDFKAFVKQWEKRVQPFLVTPCDDSDPDQGPSSDDAESAGGDPPSPAEAACDDPDSE